MEFKPLTGEDKPKIRFLVVDDSVFARKNICKMVEAFGGEIAGEAGDGIAAIAKYNDTLPDIVLMDITMPKMEASRPWNISSAITRKRASSWFPPWVTRTTFFP